MAHPSSVPMLVRWFDQRQRIQVTESDNCHTLHNAIAKLFNWQHPNDHRSYQVQYYDEEFETHVDLAFNTWDGFEKLRQKLLSILSSTKTGPEWSLKVVTKVDPTIHTGHIADAQNSIVDTISKNCFQPDEMMISSENALSSQSLITNNRFDDFPMQEAVVMNHPNYLSSERDGIAPNHSEISDDDFQLMLQTFDEAGDDSLLIWEENYTNAISDHGRKSATTMPDTTPGETTPLVQDRQISVNTTSTVATPLDDRINGDLKRFPPLFNTSIVLTVPNSEPKPTQPENRPLSSEDAQLNAVIPSKSISIHFDDTLKLASTQRLQSQAEAIKKDEHGTNKKEIGGCLLQVEGQQSEPLESREYPTLLYTNCKTLGDQNWSLGLYVLTDMDKNGNIYIHPSKSILNRNEMTKLFGEENFPAIFAQYPDRFFNNPLYIKLTPEDIERESYEIRERLFNLHGLSSLKAESLRRFAQVERNSTADPPELKIDASPILTPCSLNSLKLCHKSYSIGCVLYYGDRMVASDWSTATKESL